METIERTGFGVVTFWTLSSNTDRAKLQQALNALGLDTPVPERTAQAALRAAMEQHARATIQTSKTTRVLVRPLEDRDGYAIVQEEAEGQSLYYSPGVKATLAEDGSLNTYGIWDIEDAYRQEQNILPAANVAGMLTGILSRLGAVALREKGGVYWLPQDAVDAWGLIAKAVEASGEGNAVFQVKTGLDGEAIRAIEAALAHEVRRDTQTIRDEIASGDLGDRALENRKAKAAAIRTKIEHYESILQRQLAGLKDLADRATTEEVGCSLVQAGDIV